MPSKHMTFAADVGGTFTDFVSYDEQTGRLSVRKKLSTPPDFSSGILDCARDAGLDLHAVRAIKHGSTVAINTLLERNGATVALITTRGFRDVLELRRGNRPSGLDLGFRALPALVERRHRYEISERIGGDGEIIAPLVEADVERVIQALREEKIEAVAVCLINAYLNPAHERRVGEILRAGGLFVTLSHELSREWREYERSSTTVVNAYVGPRVSGYLHGLESKLERGGFGGALFIMQSNGGVIPADTAKTKPVLLIESGPVAGVTGTAAIAKRLGLDKTLAFDMGGTTAKCSMLENAEPVISSLYWVEGYARGYPIQAPVVDIIEVGAGGGSIAWVDKVGALKVGPRSAAAVPGPACYGRGGTEPTVTDANLLLGRLNPDYFLGGEMRLDVEAARAAVRPLADRFGLDPVEMASGIIRLANLAMSSTVRKLTIERGHDPREFALVGYGGAGPLHICAIAAELGIPRVIIPRLPGYFSAWGMLSTNLRLDYARTFLSSVPATDLGAIEGLFAAMEDEAARDIRRESGEVESIRTQRFADMRYVGQDHSVLVPVPSRIAQEADRDAVLEAFNRIYLQRFGHVDDHATVEFVNLRVAAEGGLARAYQESIQPEPGEARSAHRPVYFAEAGQALTVPVYRRDALEPGVVIEGPCIVEEYASTTVVHPGDRLTVHDSGLLMIDIQPAGPAK